MSNEQGKRPSERQALLTAVAAQQKQIDSLTQQAAAQDRAIAYIASLAGVGKQVTAMRKSADVNNPASPYPDPPSEAPTETTQEAATPEAADDVRNPGMTPGSVNDLAADTTTVALEPGTALPTEPFTNLVNPQAPIAGTETQLPLEQTRIETDVRVSPNADPAVNPQTAFPWTMASKSDDSSRTMASIRLARLQIEAGVVSTNDDLALGAQIEKSAATDAEINATIKTLESVKTASKKQRPAGLVPRSASAQRSTPSMSGDGVFAQPMQVQASSVTADVADSDLFDS